MRSILFTILAYFLFIGSVLGWEIKTFTENTPSTISKHLQSVYYILPQKQIGPYNGKQFKTIGLKPATAFMINSNFLVTAKHAPKCYQSVNFHFSLTIISFPLISS